MSARVDNFTMYDKIAAVLESLLMLDDSPGSIRRWRMAVAICCFVFILHILWACGYGARLGIEGFARTKEIKEITTQLAQAAYVSTDLQVKLLKKSIIDARVQQCSASQKGYSTNRLSELTDEYFRLTKREFIMPRCDEVQ